MKFLDRNPPQFTPDEAQELVLKLYNFSGELTPLYSERDQNFRLKTDTGASYVLKIANVEEAPGVVDFQTEALRHIQAQDPTLPVPRVIETTAGEAYTTVTQASGTTHIVRVLSWLPGQLVRDVAVTSALREDIGRTLARLDLALSGFFHPHARQEILWDVTQCASLRPHTHHISDPEIRALVEANLDHFMTEAMPQLSKGQHQVIHMDAHRANVLVDPKNPTQVAGLLDFGDMVYAPIVLEIGVAADIRGLPQAAIIDAICAIASGYDRIKPLSEIEVNLIFDVVRARMSIGATITGWRRAETPNQPADYMADLEESFWQSLRNLETLGRGQVRDHLRAACRFPVYCNIKNDGSSHETESVEALLDRRRKVLGNHLALFYDTPVHLERGEGVWLYDPQGRAYLDGYNNVPVVGHCHPHVVRAVTRQTSALNTHTRYLYQVIVDYAERIVSTLPPHLNVCSFVNSGSEANDIAWRMAKFLTGNEGGLVVEGAYHGITDAIIHLSPSTGKQRPNSPHIQKLIEPDPYRGPYRIGEPNLAEKYAADAERAISELARAGYEPAAFMLDSLFVSNGTPDVPEGYVKMVVEKVREAGGLFIADEVQAGFYRSGTHLWGHMLHGVEADIVTMGKPVGSGYPLGVVVTQAEMLDEFVSRVGLFSTFGGNPVACAAGLAVLEVIQQEGFQANVIETGDYLRDGIRGLMDRHPLIGDVRGWGLMVSVELVRDHDTKEPAIQEARRLINLMRDEGVLISVGGMRRNILKIRPPLVFQREHADVMLAALDKSLAAF